jgi:hypothetical protein
VGRLSAEELGLPRRRARELTLRVAWQRVAGDALARRAVPLSIERGVLVVGIADERWIDTARALIPRLVGRLAGAHPELGVRRCRLRVGDRDATEAPVRIVPEEPGEAGTAEGDPSVRPSDEGLGTPELPVASRLELAMERYLEQGSRRRTPERPRR